MVAPAFPGTQLMNVKLFPYVERLTPSMAMLFRGDLRDHEFSARLAAHEVLRVNATGSRVASGFSNALLSYLVVKNNSRQEHVRVTVQLNDYPAALTTINVPPGVPMVIRHVNYGSYVPLIQCLTGDAEVEVMFFAFTTAQAKRGDFLHVMPGETTWEQAVQYPTLDYCYLRPEGLYVPKPAEEDTALFGVNLYLPLSLRTKNPLYLVTLWAQWGSPTVAGDAHLPMTVVGYDKAFQRLVPLGILDNYATFVGGVGGLEDVYGSQLDLAPYIAGNLNLESIGLLWTRTAADQLDTLEAPVIFRNARTLL